MTRKISYVTLLLIMLFPINVFALSCTYDEQARLRKLATNIIPSYTYEENNNSINFIVTITNMNPDLYIVDSTNGNRYNYNGNSEISISGYAPGSKIKYTVYTTKIDCVKSYLVVKYINLPNYNKYYNSPLCKDIENYTLCAKWQLNNYSQQDFEKKINEYKNSIKKDENDAVENEYVTKKGITDYIYEIFSKYYIYFIGGFVVLILVISIVNIKKDKIRI